MLDYMYTGTYDELPSKAPAKEGEEPTQKAAKVSPAAHVMLHAKMMELGDIYMVEGLSQHASEKFKTLLAPETTRNIVVDIVPEVWALKFDSSTKIREIVVHSLRKKLHPPPLATDIVETFTEALRVVPEFGNDMLMSYCNVSNHGTNFRWGPRAVQHSRRSRTLKEGTGSVYEIKESSSLLVESPQKAAKLSPAAHVMLHVKMMELGDIYMVEGLS
ncbi:hypothetical protein E4U32_002930 [Claviceps aff. humidiphila group G2b]|nr:hypothetical protein E4U32_002930 [Claviceps aff. humidiphila group G2b]